MRIALFTETFLPKIDGIVTRLKYTIDYLQRSGHQVFVFAPDRGIKEYKGSEVIGVPGFSFPLYPELKLAIPRPMIGKALESIKPDLIHVVNPAVLGLGGIQSSKKFNIPLMASYHTHLPQYLQHYKIGFLKGLLWKILRGIHNQAKMNLCTSSAMQEELQDNGIQNVKIWQRGVDTELFHPSRQDHTIREYLSQNHPEQPLLLYVGRLGAEKRIENIKPILESLPDSRLAIIGDGPQRAELERYFEGTNTFFAGYMTGEQLAAAYASADAFIFPSTTETLGLVLLEAMAAGCPVVAACSGGIPDIVTDGVNGYLFDPENGIESSIAATQRLLQNMNIREQIHANARTEAERWAWEAATQQLESFYKTILTESNQ